jgi:hypothetical protein
MEGWRTYTPDGRVLAVEYADGRWVADCDGRRGTATTARVAISTALGSQTTSIGTSDESLADWISTQAARLEAEVG